MHVFFSGIGGAAIGPLALIAHQAGFTVSGSDKQNSAYIAYLRERGISDIHIGQTRDAIADVHARKPIDWFVYTSALPIEFPDAPELRFCEEQHIKATKRDEFLTFLIEEKQFKLIAIAGTHGKTTTTAMMIWLLKQLNIPVSYSVGAKMSFGEMGEYNPASEYFVYEADEFDRNFLAFHPYLALIVGVDWDHPDIYPTKQAYDDAFRQFISQSEWSIAWQNDIEKLDIENDECLYPVDPTNPQIDEQLTLPGHVNRMDAWQVAYAVQQFTNTPMEELIAHMNRFPGVGRRFEQIAPHIYSDYAHTPPKIRGALQLAHEVAGESVVVVYEGLHNTRQHFIKDELKHLFDDVKQLYVVPSYLAREDPKLALLSPDDLVNMLSSKSQKHATGAQLDNKLAADIRAHVDDGDLVLCISAGGGGSLDEWVRRQFAPSPQPAEPKTT